MKKTPPSPQDLETMSEAYKELLQKAVHTARQTGERLSEVLTRLKGEMTTLGQTPRPDQTPLAQFIQRDLTEAAHYLNKTGEELSTWLGFEEALIESTFWNVFSAAADQTTTELADIALQAAYAPYHTGEIAGLGTLSCDRCGEQLHFHKPGHLPPCPKCHGTSFHRQVFP